MTFLKGWRTRLLALAVSLLGMLELFAPNVWATLLPKEWQGWSLIAVAVAIYWLRQVTNTAAGKSQ
jgi:hypothetical protein